MLQVIPTTLDVANDLVAQWHRHHPPVVGYRFALLCIDEIGLPHGVVIVGRPVSRMIDQYRVAEVSRLATDGHKNACSILYGAAARVAKAMGFQSIQTYILDSESGVSLKASGWQFEAISDGGTWDREQRERKQKAPTNQKLKFTKTLNPKAADLVLSKKEKAQFELFGS